MSRENTNEMTETKPASEREVDQLVYVGHEFPRWLRLIWTIFLVSGTIYLLIYMLPDLNTWLAKFGK
jgi:hypothetical protein